MITDKMLSEMIGINSPWSISKSEFDMEKKTLEIHVHCASKYWVDDDGNRLTIHGYEVRSWRHLNMFEFTTWITARIPRLKLPSQKAEAEAEDDQQGGSGEAPRDEVGQPGPKPKTMLMPVPWAEPHVRFTKNLELFIIEVLKACKTVKEAAGLLHMSWDEVDGVMQRAVKRGLMRRSEEPIEYLCIDEKAFGKGHNYATIVADSGCRF
jgi:transposase